MDNLESPEKAAVALAEFILVLESESSAGGPAAGIGNFQRSVPLKEHDAPTRTAIASLEGMLETEPLIEARDRALTAPEHESPAKWVHGDLRPGNLLKIKGNLSAVIDFGCLGVGDSARGLQIAWNFFSNPVRNVFRERMSVTESAWERGRGWAPSMRSWLCRATGARTRSSRISHAVRSKKFSPRVASPSLGRGSLAGEVVGSGIPGAWEGPMLGERTR